MWILSNQLVEFFGYIIFEHDIFMYHRKVQSVDWTTLAFVCDLQCFLGFLNFYQHVITHCFMLVVAFTLLIWKDQHFFVGNKKNTSFQFEGFLHNYFTIDSCTPFKPFVNHLFYRQMVLTLHECCIFITWRRFFFILLTFILISFSLLTLTTW